MDIDTIEAGREMDALIAEKVMGQLPPQGNTTWWGLPDSLGGFAHPRSYSTDIAAFRSLLMEMRRRGFYYSISDFGNGVTVWFGCLDVGTINEANTSDSIMLAGCRAALKAVQLELA